MTTLQAIRTLTIRSTTEGVTDSTAALKGLQSAHEGVADAATRTATVTDAASKRQLSIAEAYKRQTLALDDAARQQDRIAKATRVADQAFQQGVITQDQYNQRLGLIQKSYAGVTAANDNFTKSAGLARHELVNLSRQAQDIGVSLASGQSPFTVLVQQGTQVADIFSNSQGSIRGFGAQVAAVITPARALAGVVALVAVAAVAAALSWQKFALQLDDTAKQAGVAATEMAKLQAAASFKGISNEDSAKAFGGFSQAVYDAKNNMGSLGELMRANGVQARDFNGFLERTADLIKNAASDQQRLVLLQQAGLPATMQWVRFMSQGAEGLREAKKQAVEFGGALNDHLVTKAREFDEAWNKFTTNFGLRWRSLSLDAIGLFDRLLDRAKAGYLLVAPEATKRTIFNLSGGMRLSQADANAFYGVTGAAPATPAGRPTTDPNALKQQLSLEQQRIGILGQLATVEQQVRSREIEIQTARLNGVKITREQEQAILGLARATADGTLAMRAQADTFRIEAETVGMAIGKATELRLMREKEAEAARLGLSVSAQTRAAWQAEAAAAGAAAQALEKKRIAAQISFDRQAAFLSPEDVQIAQQLKGLYGDDIPAALASSEAAAMRFNNALKFGADLAKEFTLDLAKAVLSGQHLGDALVASLDKVAGKLLDKSFQDALTALATMDPMMAAKAGVEAVAAVGLSLFTGESKKRKQEAEALEKAQEAWHAMAKDFEAFSQSMRGTVIGSVQKEVDAARDKALEFFRAATKAGDTGGANQALQDFSIGAGRMVREFQQQAGHVINLMNAGGGLDSPMLQAFQKTVQVAQQVKGFVSDTEEFFRGIPSVVAAAHEAAQNFALSLLDIPKPLSETQQRIQDIQGTALALNQVLIDLGMSSADAASAIDDKLNKALADLAGTFTDNLARELNEATGKGFINELNDLIKRTAQQRSDAALLPNVDTSLIDRLFAAQAQKIVDNAGLAGDALNDLFNVFPGLIGVVHDATDALEQQAEAQRELDRVARSIVDYVSDLRAGSESALSPSARLAAAQSTFNAILPLAQGGDTQALGRITQDFENLRKAAQAVYGSSAAYQTILDTGINQLLALPAVSSSTDPIVAAVRDVVTAVQGTTSAVGVTTATVQTGNATLAAANTLQTSANSILTTANSIATSQTNLLDAIRALQDTSTQQLQLFNQQLSGSQNVITQPVATAVGLGIIITAGNVIQNTMLQALNKIVWNTFVTADKVGRLVGGTAPTGAPSPVFAQGGIAQPGQSIIFGEHHPRGPFFGRVGSEPIAITPAMPALPAAPGWVGANDNGRVVAALDAIVSRLDRLERTVANVVMAGTGAQLEASKREIMELRKQTAQLERGQREASTRQDIARKTG